MVTVAVTVSPKFSVPACAPVAVRVMLLTVGTVLLTVVTMVLSSDNESAPAVVPAAMPVATSAMLSLVKPVMPNVCKAACSAALVGKVPPSAASCTTLTAVAKFINSVALSTSTPCLPSTTLLSKLACAGVPAGDAADAAKTPKA